MTLRACEQLGTIIEVWHRPTVHYKVSEGPGLHNSYVNIFEHNWLILAPFEHRV